ncbi:substrate binding domain-containing protein [Microbulbifer sp. OS29]|uniref:Substrate binding domain-containing protein n=1 Tax=Microbulbifer okhotskensis TaxID=2926617 RepID=A0A9X2J6Y1_9GAMM|nr:substrate binding domain-containing protein [Microbulbifer okhotskensis]MCO1335924.1 substrate binding domain-containing protein [Microbulbifer okhotskensis]
MKLSEVLYRNTRKLSLTEDGEKVYKTADKILQLYTDGLGAYNEGENRSIGRLKIAIPAVLIHSRLLSKIVYFARQELGLYLEFQCSDLHEDLIGGGFDLAIRLGNMPDSTLKARKIFQLQRVLLASADMLERFGVPEHPRELEAWPWIGLTMRPNNRTFNHREYGDYEINYTPVATVNNIEAAYRLTSCGLGLSVPPRFLLRPQDELQEVLPAWQLPSLPAYAVRPSNALSQGPVQRLVDYLSDSDTQLAACHPRNLPEVFN